MSYSQEKNAMRSVVHTTGEMEEAMGSLTRWGSNIIRPATLDEHSGMMGCLAGFYLDEHGREDGMVITCGRSSVDMKFPIVYGTFIDVCNSLADLYPVYAAQRRADVEKAIESLSL